MPVCWNVACDTGVAATATELETMPGKSTATTMTAGMAYAGSSSAPNSTESFGAVIAATTNASSPRSDSSAPTGEGSDEAADAVSAMVDGAVAVAAGRQLLDRSQTFPSSSPPPPLTPSQSRSVIASGRACVVLTMASSAVLCACV